MPKPQQQPSKMSKPAISGGVLLPFPSAPSRPGKYCLYMSKGTKLNVHIFAAAYSAKKFLDLVLDNDDYKLSDGDETRVMTTKSGLEVKCTFLDEILEHEYSHEESKWELPEPYRSTALRVRLSEEEVQDLRQKHEDHKDAKASEKSEKKEKKEKRKKIDKSGLVTVGDIAKKLDLEARECRAILRKSDLEKPEAGWAWPKDEVEKIKNIIKLGL